MFSILHDWIKMCHIKTIKFCWGLTGGYGEILP